MGVTRTSSANRKSVTFKMGIAEILTLLFLTLKLTDVIDWSWWLVFLPLIIVYGIAVLIGVTAAAIAAIAK